jgi:phytoene synthase
MDDAPDEPADDPGDLDALIRRVDPDRWISSRFIADAQARADVVVLYAFDHELDRAPKASSNPLIGEIRLTWWREALDEIFEGRPVRRHPTAEALAATVARHGLEREPLERLIDARYRRLDPTPMNKLDALEWASGTAGALAASAVQVLDPAYYEFSGLTTNWAALWSLGQAVLSGAIAADAEASLLVELNRRLEEARTLERGSAPANVFPAVAHATLARVYRGKRTPSPLEKRLRITLAVARGRI